MFFPDAEDLAVYRKLNFKDPDTWIAVWGGFGFMKPGPGTWGSLGALPFGLLFFSIGREIGILILLAGVIYFGMQAIRSFQEQTQTNDHKMIVVDEVAGMLIAMIPAGMNPFLLALAFILFRVFDIFKPGPIKKAEALPGERGVMMDDIVAGVFAAVIVLGVRLAGIGG